LRKRKARDYLEDFVRSGLVTDEQLQIGLKEAERSGKSALRVLIEKGFLTDDDVRVTGFRWQGYETVELGEEQIDTSVVAMLPERLARSYSALPLRLEDNVLVVAMADPTNIIAVDDIRTMTGREVRVVIAAKADIEEALVRHQSLDSAVEMASEPTPDDDEDGELAVEDAPIVKLINEILSRGVQMRASDIHVEPQERDVRIRYRIDGVLHEITKTQKSMQASMISRLKVMADLNIAERRVPQDGRITANIDGKPIDLRVATLPSVWGEKVVLRILDRAQSVLRLEDLGFSEQAQKRYEESFTRPYGALLVTGPTGSGKSTTLYATLNIINKTERNTITVEDPVEYRLPGLTQVQINPKAGLTFAGALRSILRSDPDTVMIGEIRDRETANIAIESALTGHLVLSTLHTNDAPSAATRLVEMGVEPFLVASALDCVLAQRLARRLCERCKEEYVPTPEALIEHRFPWRDGEPLPTLQRPVGCQHCAKTGYRGRVALIEVMIVTEEVERLIVEHRPSEDIKRMAVEQGMRTLREDGMDKVRLGITSIEEILRVVV